MERLTERFDGWVVSKGCHGPCRTCNGAECADIYPMIDRLAAYEDTELTPEEVSEYRHLCDSYVEAGLDAKFVQFCIDATQNGLSMNHICELAQAEKDGRLMVLPPNDPLTLEQLREMDGEPVFCFSKRVPEDSAWGIVCIRDSVPYVRTIQDKGRRGCFFYLTTYGTAWLAYRRKPKEGLT